MVEQKKKPVPFFVIILIFVCLQQLFLIVANLVGLSGWTIVIVSLIMAVALVAIALILSRKKD